jgi:hypothetical protein
MLIADIRPIALVACIIALVSPSGVAGAAVAPTPSRSKADVEALIKKEGETPPPWWSSVQLVYPPTLDLTWKKPPKGSPWESNKWLGQYIWSVINENPGRWKEGAKLPRSAIRIEAGLGKEDRLLSGSYIELRRREAEQRAEERQRFLEQRGVKDPDAYVN